MAVTFEKDFAVDFIRDNQSAVFDNDFTEADEVFAVPKAANRVLRIAKDDSPGTAGGRMHAIFGSKLSL